MTEPLRRNKLMTRNDGKISRLAENIKEGFSEYLAKGRSVLVALSGGADSSFLLFLMHRLSKEMDFSLYAAHVNHGIRGDEAIRDRDFCKDICRGYGIELFLLETDVPSIAKERGVSVEAAARDVRYDFFDEIMFQESIDVLVTAHNADDNLETILFRLARGTGIDGLCGIPPMRRLKNEKILLRPILSLEKTEIIELCNENGIEFVVDSTNSDIAYTRNLIRHRVLPVLKEINPDIYGAAGKTAHLLSLDADYLSREAESRLLAEDCDGIDFLNSQHAAIRARIISLLYGKKSSAMLEAVHIEAIMRLIDGGRPHSEISLPDEISAVIEDGRLTFVKKPRNKSQIKKESCDYLLFLSENEEISVGGVYKVGFYTEDTHKTRQNQINDKKIHSEFTQISIPYDKIKGKLYVRQRSAGDKIRACNISKDVRKLFSENKIPLAQRDIYPIFCDDDGILWIPGIALRDGVNNKKEKNNENLAEKVRLTFR